MGESSSSPALASSSSPALALSSPPFSISNSSSTDASHSIVFNPLASLSESSALQNLSTNIHSLISTEFHDSFSDVLIYVADCVVPLHRCILVARCPFFKSLFSKDSTYLASFAPKGRTEAKSRKLKVDLDRLLSSLYSIGRVSHDAFMSIVGFLYSGQKTVLDVRCIDDQCLHEACRPVLNFAVEMLGLSSVFDIVDLKIFWQHHLQDILEKAQVDEVIPVLIAAKVHGADSLLSLSQHFVAVSNMSTVDIEKQLPMPLSNEVLILRCKMGLLQPETLNPTHERESQRIRKALDSDDVELVQLLLKEGRVSLDGAHALHYAVAYCDARTVKDILELGLADVNARNNRGFTVLHTAAMRQEPSILVSLLSKGANPLDTTPDGRTSLQLCSRLMRRFSNDSNVEAADLQKECLCVEILYQAGMRDLFEDTAFPPAADEKELLSQLFYLENRVALARLLFPQEASLVLNITHLESTSEFVGFRASDFPNQLEREDIMDLNQVPSTHISMTDVATTQTSISTPVINEALVKRVEALQRTAALGRRMFPRCISILNSFTDDDPSELMSIKSGNSEEHKSKRRRYMELKDMIAEAFQKDVAAMERVHKPDKSCE